MAGLRIESHCNSYLNKVRNAIKKRKEKYRQKHFQAHKGGLPPKAGYSYLLDESEEKA